MHGYTMLPNGMLSRFREPADMCTVFLVVSGVVNNYILAASLASIIHFVGKASVPADTQHMLAGVRSA